MAQKFNWTRAKSIYLINKLLKTIIATLNWDVVKACKNSKIDYINLKAKMFFFFRIKNNIQMIGKVNKLLKQVYYIYIKTL